MDNGRPQTRSNSLLYLALLCLVYYAASGPGMLNPYTAPDPGTPEKIYIEIVRDGKSSILPLDSSVNPDIIAAQYNIDRDLKNGLKVTYQNGGAASYGRISGVRSMSLGIPIGLNSGDASDLAALPGIGEKLAGRIISYREESGGFKSVDEVLNIDGIGDKKLSAIREFVSLD